MLFFSKINGMRRQRNVTKGCFLANIFFSLKQMANDCSLIKGSISKRKPYGADTATNGKILVTWKMKRKPFKA